MHEEEEFFDLLHLVDRFSVLLKEKEVSYFDVDQFEAICDYYYEMGKMDQAMEVIHMAAEQHPGHHGFALRKVQLLTAINKTEEADREMAVLEGLVPNSFDLFVARAALQSKMGNHQKAINYYRQALSKAEFPEDIWGIMAMEYQMLGHYEQAKKYLKLTVEANPDDEMAVYNLALSFDMLEETEEARNFFSKFVDLNPYSEVGWYHLGIIEARLKHYDQAIRALDYALLIDEYFSAAYFEKARLMERTFRYQEAADTYKATFDIDGPTGFTYYKIGKCYLHLHKHKKALSYFTKAVHEDEELDEAFYELALIKDEDRDWLEAVHYAKKALELDPENIEYLILNADVLKRAGQLDEAEMLYEKLLENGQIDPFVFMDYAELLFDMCEFEKGMDLLYQGVQLNPDSAEIHLRLAGYLFTIEEADEAAIYFQKGLRINPDKERVFFILFPQLKNDPQVIGSLRKAQEKGKQV